MNGTTPGGATPVVLSIAGSDPSGGAGIQGDLRTFAALGAYGCAVPTALTAQNTLGVRAAWPLPADVVTQQIETLLDDVEVAAVKIGMLGDAAVVRAVAAALRRYAPPHVVLDPVLRASAGGVLLDADGLAALRDELLPLVDLVTPNVQEAGVLLGESPPRSEPAARDAARRLLALGARAVLLTGGHLEEESARCVDVLATSGAVRVSSVARVPGSAHGTGCALSSAIAVRLARGDALADACVEAQAFVAAGIRNAGALRVGRGTPPINVSGS